MARFATYQTDPLRDERPAWNSLFDLMEQYQNEHPEASDDEAYEAVCWRVIPDRAAAMYDQQKEARREQY